MAGGWPHDDSRSVRTAGGLAIFLTLVALVGSTHVALQRTPGDPGTAAAGIIPEVVYTEQELASLAPVAHVNAAIGEEVTRDEVPPAASDQERPLTTPASGGAPRDRPAAAEERNGIDGAVEPTEGKPSDAPDPGGADKSQKPSATTTTTTTAPPTETSEPSDPERRPSRSSETTTTTTTTTTTEPTPPPETTTTTEPQKPKGKKG